MARVIVVGAGVIGLTSAVRLAEAGHRVDVVARDLPLETTSAVAGAFWYPYLAGPRERVAAWATRSYAAFCALAEDPTSGVVLREGTEAFTGPAPEPWWRDAVPGIARETALPAGYADGWTFTTPVVEMPVYLPWLASRLEAAGGTLTRLNLPALPPTDDGVDVVVNCAGLGARLFAGDLSVVPVRGQVAVLEQVGLERWFLDAGDEWPRFVVPRSSDVVVGGTVEEGEWSRTPDPEIGKALVARAVAVVPELARARVLRHKVGLRPARPEVRVERAGDVVHCYGHGGAGVTLSWGCADEVVRLVETPAAG
ncbi:MAG TPA: FAD-dependent oxidoreductase [Nocardioides sp.]|nr:FAD-dependent oxidoreductase [Nocardioides sp.]